MPDPEAVTPVDNPAWGRSKRPLAVLSIDGGGIRGILPARLLAALELRAGAPCSELFDLVAGTSTGGILALGLARHYQAADLVELYRTEGARIFSKPLGYELDVGGGVLGPNYPAAGIEGVLLEYFGATKLDEASVPALVTAYDTLRPGPTLFKSWAKGADAYLMRDIARATSAAPTYFPPLQAGPSTYIDGGVFANNPVMCACASLPELFGDPRGAVVVSVGTGNTEKKCDPVGWGLARWAPALIDVFMDGTADVADMQAAALLGDRYHRFQFDLGAVSQEMDDIHPVTLAGLLAVADGLVAKSGPELDALAKLLKSRR